MRHNIILTVCFALFNILGYAQNKKNYFIVKGQDTTHCQKLDYRTNAQGYLAGLEYTDDEGKSVALDGKKNVPDVVTICVDNVIYDKIPLKASKPDSYIRYTERVVDGKVKVYLARPHYNENIHGGSGGPVGKYRFFVKAPDGTYYDVMSGDFKKQIKPMLESCPEFKSGYKEEVNKSEDRLMKAVNYYNSVCK